MSMLIDAYRFGGGGGGPGPSTYSPAFWYDADDLTTLFQDAAGTIPVTADGDPVGRWEDKSGNGRHWTQSTSGARPTYHTSGGVSWIESDGVNDWMTGSTGMLAFADLAVFIGMRVLSGGGDFGLIIGHGHDTTHTNPFYRWSLQTRNSGGNTLDYHINGSRVDLNVAAAAVGSDVLIALGYTNFWNSGSGTQQQQVLRANSALVSNQAGTTSISYPNSNVSTLFSNVTGTGDFGKARIYSILGASSPVTSQAHIDNWEAYINTKF